MNGSMEIHREFDRWRGVLRSLVVYHGIPWRGRQLRNFYSRFVPEGGLAFDVGAHSGNRVCAFSKLGARVVALEPQPDFARWLRRRFKHHPSVQVLQTAVGSAPGEAQLLVSPRTPTVSTLSPNFVAAAGVSESFRGVEWHEGPMVRVVTLDALIAEYGLPDFVKIDVEGFELEVLRGLSQALPALSFEFLPAVREIALGCVDRLETLASDDRYRYAVSLGEQLHLLTTEGVSAADIRKWLRSMPADAPSGDVHAWLPESHAASGTRG